MCRKKCIVAATNRAVPVQFADSALLQMLLGTCNVMTLRQVLNDLLPRPAAWEKSSLRLRETPLDVGHKAVIGTGSAELVWVLKVESFVCSTYLQRVVSMNHVDWYQWRDLLALEASKTSGFC